MSRLDNDFNKYMHDHPWIALGIFKTHKMVRYEHSDAGLSFSNLKIKKLHTFKELWEKNVEIVEKGNQYQGFRQFREFQDVQEEEVLITIEYCTNCHLHTGSTRHQEEEYYDAAVQLRSQIIKHFPCCKVLLKPLIYDPLDHSIDTMFLQRRLGCFEVQVISLQKGELRQEVIFSKLRTKQWPNPMQVIARLPKFFKKCNLTIQLKFYGQDSIDDEKELEQLETKLKNVLVKVRPIRDTKIIQPSQRYKRTSKVNSMISMRRNVTYTINSPPHRSNASLLRSFNAQSKSQQHQQNPPQQRRTWSGQTRPKSAYSMASVQSTKTHRTTKPALDQTNSQTYVEEFQFQDKTNAMGQVVLRDMPIDIYEVSIQETNDFMNEVKRIDLFDIIDRHLPFIQNVELRKQTHSFLVIEAYEATQFDESYPRPLTGAKVEIISVKSGSKIVTLKETPAGSGRYEIVVDPGMFQVFVKKVGYAIYEERILAHAGVQQVQVKVMKVKPEDGYDPVAEAVERKLNNKPPDDLYTKKPKFLNPPIRKLDESLQKINIVLFEFLDIVRKTPIQNVYIRVLDEINNRLYSYRSNNDGICKVMLKSAIQRGRIIIEHSEYYDKTEIINEQKILSNTEANKILLVQRPLKGQVTLLIQNSVGIQKINFYILQPGMVPIQENHQVTQYYNQDDGVQLVEFKDLNDRKGALQVVACLSDQVIKIQNITLLLPTGMQQIKLPKLPQNTSGTTFPYFWVVGSMNEPYEFFDSSDMIIGCNDFYNLPSLIRPSNVQVLKALIQQPLYLITGNQDKSLSWWSLETLTNEFQLFDVVQEEIIDIQLWDDENIICLDSISNLVWVRKDDSQQWIIANRVAFNKYPLSISRIGIDGLAISTKESFLCFFSVKIDNNGVYIIKEGEILEKDSQSPIYKVIQIASDQVATLSDKICIWKGERNIDKLLIPTLLKIIQLPLISHTGQPYFTTLAFDFRVFILGGSNGQLHTIKLDTYERGPSLMWNQYEQVKGLLQLGDQGIITQTSTDLIWTQVDSLQDIKDNKTYLVRKFTPPGIQLYNGEPFFWEGKLLTFSKQGSLLIYPLIQIPAEPISHFLQSNEYPISLRPESEQVSFFLALTDLPRDFIQFYFINPQNEVISLNSDSIAFIDKQKFFFVQILHTGLEGAWRVCARLQNTEKIKQSQVKLYYIHHNGYQQLLIPSNLPQSKKQIYHWLIGTIVYPNIHIFTSQVFTDGSIQKFCALEQIQHEGKINCLIQLNDDEFISAAEDGKWILWDAKTFQIKKTFFNENKCKKQKIQNLNIIQAEILTFYKISDLILLIGLKTGEIQTWKRIDPQGNYLILNEIKHHEKGVYSIITLENNTVLVSASDDRKLNFITFPGGQLEVSETVDRTFVISLIKYSKDTFAGGFPDGRVKIWKRVFYYSKLQNQKEKSGQKVLIKLIKTIDKTVKVQHMTQINQNVIFVGGSEKLAETCNIETGIKLKQLKDGHQSSILCSLVYSKKYILSGGVDGRISIWNTETATLVKSIETGNDEIRQLIMIRGVIITAGSQGSIRIWQDIIPLLEQLIQAEEEQQRQKEKLLEQENLEQEEVQEL